LPVRLLLVIFEWEVPISFFVGKIASPTN